MNEGSVQEHVAATRICDDEAKASFPYPTVDMSILKVTGGTILESELFRGRSVGWEGEIWALDRSGGGRFAHPFAWYDWTREWIG